MTLAGVDVTVARLWAQIGTVMFLAQIHRHSAESFDAATDLEGWTRAHLVAHVASNAQALARLADWARTGVESPMYASIESRDADIESGALLDSTALTSWVKTASADLEDRFDSLSPEAWNEEVRTIQGRTVLATDLPWLRAREVCVHSIDLADGALTFSDFPSEFVHALLDDVVERRSAAGSGPALDLRSTDTGTRWTVVGHGSPAVVRGDDNAIAAWLTGRSAGVDLDVDSEIPTLPRWL